MKKAQIQSELLKYILVTVVAFLIIVFSIILIRNLSEKKREAELVGFKSDIASSIEVIATRYGSVDREIFEIPEDIELVCFLDLSKREEILETPLVDKYIFMKDSLESEAAQNIFLIANDMLSDTLYDENVCFKSYPYYQCVETSFGQLDLLLQGLGSCTTIFTNYTAYISDNVRNSTIYDKIANGGFLAKDTEDHENYRDTLQIIPLAFVNNKDFYSPYPYLVYYGNIDDNKIKDILNNKGLNSVIIFRGKPYGEYTINGYTVIDDNLNNYFSYWDVIYDVTVVGYNNEDASLIASLFAAFTNTPLIFINNDNLNNYKEFLKGKTVNVIDENLIDNEVIDYIEDLKNDISPRYFDSDDLRILRQNRILKLESGIIIP